MNEQERIAADIFSKYGMDFKTAIRARGWTNAVWLNGDLALRLSLKKDSDRIRREVKLSEYLPDAIGYPVNLAVGQTDGYEWSLSKRIYANNLSDNWGNMDWKERTEAIQQILKVMNVLHLVDVSSIQHLSNKNAWYSSFDAQETYSCFEKYKQLKIFSAEQIDNLYSILERFWPAHQEGKPVLNHGDITTDNLLWANGKIVTLMDFEHSVIAPSALDLHSLINLALFPYEEDILITSDNQGYQQYKNDVIAMLKPMLKPSGIDLILGYAILFRMRFLEFWLANPEGKLEDHDAYNKLLSIANGEGGYLSEVLCS